ncbi:MAG: FAD-dependent oxidoreductase [Nitrospirota bacterium]|jgi:NADPH-dependent glutamate synthase beta subunit-like oxidoreductase/glutamate synthase domain-containing protein 3
MPAKKKTTAGKKAPGKKAAAPGRGRRVVVEGTAAGQRVSSRVLEESIQEAVRKGARNLLVKADGQHGIGGRIWPRGEKVKLTVEGPAGQRLGSMGMTGTEIVVKGGVSDDVGWINCGATITVLGDVTNGAHNAAAQGKLYVRGGGGARCDTMTKYNPRFDPPESWYFRSVGDSFAEFKAGGIAVVCGVDPRDPQEVLGYRPCVGMVGGTIYFRGPIRGWSEGDVKCAELTPQDWEWLTKNMKPFLRAIGRTEHYEELTRSIADWRKLIAYTPQEKQKLKKLPLSMSGFRADKWEQEVGGGGIFGPYISHERTLLPYVTTGEERRNRPVWANEKYAPPCAYACPTRIPSHKRAALIRRGKMAEALNLVLQYSPLPATVCGQICPNLCMQSCTRGKIDRPLNIKEFGSLALELPAPEREAKKDYSIAVIGGGPAGLSAAWQLGLKGYDVDLYEAEDKLGGKLELCIPRDRLPREVLKKEISRFQEVGVDVHLGKRITLKDFEGIYNDHDFVVVACGAHEPRKLRFPGVEDTVHAYDFLKGINYGDLPTLAGKNVVVIGAGNVGMDVAIQSYNCGAEKVVAVDVQKPAAFGKELEEADRLGTEIIWPKFTERYDKKKRTIRFNDGSSLPADLVVVSIGEVPVLDFLPPSVHTERGWIDVDENGLTSDPKVYAIGDATKPGLVTHAIGQGRTAAEHIHSELSHFDAMPEVKEVVPYERIHTDYYDVCRIGEFKPEAEANACMSCATCRDCHMCEATCYWDAISRVEHEDGSYEYVVDADKCIGCGFCAGICPCGVWEMVENY